MSLPFKTVKVKLTVDLTIRLYEGTELSEVIQEMDYSFNSATRGGMIMDSEILESDEPRVVNF
jgi:hypothetical protein